MHHYYLNLKWCSNSRDISVASCTVTQNLTACSSTIDSLSYHVNIVEYTATPHFFSTIQFKTVVEIAHEYFPPPRLVFNLCSILLQPHGLSPPDSSVHGISQTRILEWAAISFSRESSWPRDQTHVTCFSRQILYHWVTREASWILGIDMIFNSVLWKVLHTLPRLRLITDNF